MGSQMRVSTFLSYASVHVVIRKNTDREPHENTVTVRGSVCTTMYVPSKERANGVRRYIESQAHSFVLLHIMDTND